MGLLDTLRGLLKRPVPASPPTPTRKPVFERGRRYPHDGVSEYVDLDGEVLTVGSGHVDDVDDNEVRVTVRTREHGEFTAYTFKGATRPPIGSRATVRLYVIGGGWYPDDRVVGWRRLSEDD